MPANLKTFRADLHVHTVLSPCAEVEMIPPLIVETALDLGINLIAVTDHNSSANIAAVQLAARDTPLAVLPGMELQTREEIHSLCLFDTLEQIHRFQELVDATLPDILNQPDHFGEQFVVDENGEFLRREDRLLITSSSLSLNDAWQIVHNLGGLFIPAHIDRKSYGLIETLGFIPTDIELDAVEISRRIFLEQARLIIPGLKSLPIIQSGDAHRLSEFLGSTYLFITQLSIAEIKLALAGKEGRKLEIRQSNTDL